MNESQSTHQDLCHYLYPNVYPLMTTTMIDDDDNNDDDDDDDDDDDADDDDDDDVDVGLFGIPDVCA